MDGMQEETTSKSMRAKCPICEKTFTKKRYEQVTCSRSCGTAYGNIRRSMNKSETLSPEFEVAHEFVQKPASISTTGFYLEVPEEIRDLVHQLRDNGFNTVDHRNGTIVCIHRIACDWKLFHMIVETNGFLDYVIESYTTTIGTGNNTSRVRFIKMTLGISE